MEQSIEPWFWFLFSHPPLSGHRSKLFRDPLRHRQDSGGRRHRLHGALGDRRHHEQQSDDAAHLEDRLVSGCRSLFHRRRRLRPPIQGLHAWRTQCPLSQFHAMRSNKVNRTWAYFTLQHLYHSSCRHARAEKQEWNSVAKEKTETELQESVKMVSDRNDRIVNGKKKRSAYI